MWQCHYVNLRRFVSLGLLFVIVGLFIDPRGATIGYQDSYSYRQIRDVLESSPENRAIYLAGFDDYYSIAPNFRLRTETSESFVEAGYDRILNAASLGDKAFNSYLVDDQVSHVVVPLSSAINDRIWHKWGNLGGISIRLKSPFFREVVRTIGEFPVVLYEVLNESGSNTYQTRMYSLEWSGVRREFYELQRKIQEVGMYTYEYSKFYSDGMDVSWVFQGTDGATDKPRFLIRTPNLPNRLFSVDVTLLAAYGGNAPTQIIRVSTLSGAQSIMVSAGKPAIVKLQLSSNELVSFDNVLPCRLPSTFDSSDGDQRRFCYGIGDIKVRAVS